MGDYNVASQRCTTEELFVARGASARLSERKLTIVRHYRAGDGNVNHSVHDMEPFQFSGSIFSAIDWDWLPDSLRKLLEFLKSAESLDMLTPEHLRQRTRAAEGSLGIGGRNLAAFVHELQPAARESLLADLKRAYPQLDAVASRSLRAGWKQLDAVEIFAQRGIASPARHWNDGMLRLLAILAALHSDHQLLLFDEIENGINSEQFEYVVARLQSASQQVVVTTHNPVLLNCLPDTTARESVQYLYRTALGDVRSIPFFEIPSQAEKLRVMGPGEAFVDTDLAGIESEIREIHLQESHAG